MEYVELINQIVAAEQNACYLAREAQEREAGLEADLAKETAQMRESYLARAKQRVEIVAQTEAAQAQEAIAALDARRTQSLNALEQAYQNHAQEWVDTLFAQVVGQKP